jgi:transcription initiation factor TFIID subunit TAF12
MTWGRPEAEAPLVVACRSPRAKARCYSEGKAKVKAKTKQKAKAKRKQKQKQTEKQKQKQRQRQIQGSFASLRMTSAEGLNPRLEGASWVGNYSLTVTPRARILR